MFLYINVCNIYAHISWITWVRNLKFYTYVFVCYGCAQEYFGNVLNISYLGAILYSIFVPLMSRTSQIFLFEVAYITHMGIYVVCISSQQFGQNFKHSSFWQPFLISFDHIHVNNYLHILEETSNFILIYIYVLQMGQLIFWQYFKYSSCGHYVSW